MKTVKKSFQKLAFSGLVLALALSLSGCSRQAKTQTYLLPDVYIGAQYLVDTHQGTHSCTEIYANEDGSLTLVLTEAQRKRWADPSETEAQLRMLEKLSGISVSYSDNYTRLEISAPADVAKAAAPMVQNFAWQAELVQILNGAENWSLQVTVKDCDTGQVLQEITLPGEALDWGFLSDAQP